MTEITEQDFDREVLKCKLPVFACLTSKWCHSCYPTCLLAEDLTKEYGDRVKFVKVDIEGSPGIAASYHVVAVPTILLFQNSQPVKRLLGFQDRRSLRYVLDKVIREVA